MILSKFTIIVFFLAILNLVNCSNSSFYPLAINGTDAANRVKLAFSEINSINPTPYILANTSQTLSESDLQTQITKGMIIASISADNWTKDVVNTKKWYKEKDVDNCVASIRRTGIFAHLLTSNVSLNSSNYFQSLLSTALIPQLAAKACNLKPLSDLYIIRTGTEGKADNDEN